MTKNWSKMAHEGWTDALADSGYDIAGTLKFYNRRTSNLNPSLFGCIKTASKLPFTLIGCGERIMNYKTLLALSAVVLLAACSGGGGGGGGDDPEPRFTTLRAFSDGAGVRRGVASDGTETVFIAPDIAEIVAIANQNNPVSDLQFSDFAIVDRQPTAVIRQGTITVEGQVANVTIVEDNGGEAGLIYLDFPGYKDAVFAVGSAFGAAPNGSFTYNGVHVIADRFFGDQQDGTFSLTADFNNRTFSYNGSTLSSSLSGSGTIDTVNGRFSSNTLNSNFRGDTDTASMYGQLHGNSAQSVSGVFHTNESDPSYAGAFVGSRP